MEQDRGMERQRRWVDVRKQRTWTDGRDLETDSKPEIWVQIPPRRSFICSLEEGMRQELTG